MKKKSTAVIALLMIASLYEAGCTVRIIAN